MRLTILAAVMMAGLLSLSAGSGAGGAFPAGVRFERVGPFGGTVRSLLISSHQADLVFLGTSDGQILKSLDGGSSWNTAHPGLEQRRLVIDTLIEHPADRGRLFAGAWDLRTEGGGLFESRDGGNHWNRVPLPNPFAAVRDMGISARDPSRMVVGTHQGVFVTDDGGRNWHEVQRDHESFQHIESVAIGADDPRSLLVGTWRLGYRSADFGKTWEANSKGMIVDSHVFSISVDDTSPQNVFLGACSGVYRSANAGRSWTRLKVLVDRFTIRTHVVYVDPTSRHRVYAGTTVGLYVSEDGGREWRRLTSRQLTVHAVQVDPRNQRKILIGTELEGILRSHDGGRTWAASNTGFANRRVSRILPLLDEGGQLAGLLSDGTTGGFYSFDQRQGQWLPLETKKKFDLPILCMLSLPEGRGRLIGTPRGVYWEKPDAVHATVLGGTISRFSANDLTLDRRSGWIYAGTSNGIYRARVQDLNFHKPAGYRLLPRVSSVVVSPSAPGIVYAATHMGLLRSRDEGVTWDVISAGLPENGIVESLTASPADAARLLAGTMVGLFESRNGGISWSRVDDDRLGGHVPTAIFLDESGMRIIAADQWHGGVFLSDDGGITWTRINSPQFGSPVNCLVRDPTRPRSVFLGTASEGIYRLQLEEARPTKDTPQSGQAGTQERPDACGTNIR